MSIFSIATGIFSFIPDKLKTGISIGLILAVGVLGFLYNRSLNTIAELKVEVKSAQEELEKVVAATNEYKEITDKMLSAYSSDIEKWQNKVAEARSDCDTRLKLFMESENVEIGEVDQVFYEKQSEQKSQEKQPVSEQKQTKKKITSTSILNNKSSKSYIEEINKRLRNAKANNFGNSSN